jgi:hypothetical protein
MKTITFNYRKKDNSVSERTLLVLVSPGDKYAGIDLSELDPLVGAEFVLKYEALHAAFMQEAAKLQAEYDLKFAYKQFFESGMSEVIEI